MVSFTTIDAIACEQFVTGTGAGGINGAGLVIGNYTDVFDITHGFLWDNGTSDTIDGPDATVTFPSAINEAGQIAGGYRLPNPPSAEGTFHAFLWDHGFANIDPPDAVADPDTGFAAIANDINAAGLIVGSYADGSDTRHGFLLQEGTFRRIDSPNSVSTSVSGINLAGVIIGGYIDSSGGTDSFVAMPRASVNDLVQLNSRENLFRRNAREGGRAGTFSITATFANTSSTSIHDPVFRVTQLSGGNLLLNADGGPGGLGATLTPDVGADRILAQAESFTTRFVVGLQHRSQFTFLVDLRGVAGP